MKIAKILLALTIVALTAACGGPKKEAQKVLVVYYSLTSNTKAVAEEIANRLGADIEEIVAVNPYDTSFKATIARCMADRDSGIFTEIKPLKADLSKYDVLFIGYPVWFGTYAPPIESFLSQVDLSGKKVVPFCTFGSGGLESSVKDMTECQPGAKILPGYGVRAARLEAMPKEVEQFLIAGGFIEGEYTAPADFPEQHPVSDEESAIFDAAVGNYPMMHAKAKSVATRTIAEGTEYLFTAVDQPREEAPKGDMKPPKGKPADAKKPAMPPAGEMQVYVTVAKGAAPVFTKVVR